MLVADLDDYLDLPDDAPGPALRAAETARAHHPDGDGRRRGCPVDQCAAVLSSSRKPSLPRADRLQRSEPAPVRWWCSVCADDGSIRNWEGSPYDLRRRTLAVVENTEQVVVPEEFVSALRGLLMLDRGVERRVFAMAAGPAGAVLSVTPGELDDLLDSVAAEANHESDRRRRRTLDAAFDLLSAAADRMRG